MDTSLRDSLVGRVVDDRYLVESLIARGGMATVYLALDRRLDREVALKVLHDHLADDQEFAARFVREARAAARLSHPNVVQVFDQGTDGPILYLTMEYLQGRTLRDVLAQRGSLTPREALSVLEPILDAIGAAHRAGIVHRDVKPENVLLADDGRIKVADFGLARAAGATATGAGAGGPLLGTVAYLAPELVSRGVADARADVYAAGIMLFEMLTGRQPFTGSDPLAVAQRHVHERVPAPSVVAPVLPVQLDALVLAATAHDPDGRPPTADRMLAAAREIRREIPEDQLDVRAVAAPTVALSETQLVAPGTVAAPQETRALSVPRRMAPQLVPRLRVHEDDEAVDDGRFMAERRRRGYGMLAAVVALALVFAVAGWWLVAGPGSYTRVPDVAGQRVEEAQRALTSAGLTATLKDVFDDTVPSGQIVSTDPPIGDRVAKGGEVTLNVSKGPKNVEVPDVTGEEPEMAEAALERAGLKPGKTTRAFDDKVEAGLVAATSPRAGEQVKPGRKVDIVVSRGPAEVPGVIGQQRDVAEKLLKDAGFKVEVTEVDPGFFGPSAGTVTGQDPAPGRKVGDDGTVRITVVRGGGPQPGPGEQLVPGVTGRSADEAEGILRAAGFDVRRAGPQQFGRVIRQNPSGNSSARPGTVIEIWIL